MAERKAYAKGWSGVADDVPNEGDGGAGGMRLLERIKRRLGLGRNIPRATDGMSGLSGVPSATDNQERRGL